MTQVASADINKDNNSNNVNFHCDILENSKFEHPEQIVSGYF